nr:MAG: hypothetical protein 1 [Gammacarmovirus sp.]
MSIRMKFGLALAAGCASALYVAYRRRIVRGKMLSQNLQIENSRVLMKVLNSQSDGADFPEEAPVESSSSTIMIGSVEVELPVAVSVKRKPKAKHKSMPFVTKLINAAKVHFDGVPKPTESNHMAVTSFIKDYCKEHGVDDNQTRRVCAIAGPLILSPDRTDIMSRAFLHGPELSKQRAEYAAAASTISWFDAIVAAPLSCRAWRRAYLALIGYPDSVGYQMVK